MRGTAGLLSRGRMASVAGLAAAALLLAACGSSSSSSTSTGSNAAATGSSASSSSTTSSGSGKHVKIAYMSFAVANTYDAPMLAAAKSVAAANNASVTVFDANNSPTTQYSQLQDAITSGGYQGIITQPIESTNLIPLVQQAISKGIKVVNIDQILGPKLDTYQKQVSGLSGNVTFVPTELGMKFGALVVQACKANNLKPCNVGYLYDIKASALDTALRDGFNQAIASDPSVKVVAEGQDFFTPAEGLKATQDMLQSNSSINLIAGSDQGIEGAQQANTSKKVVLVGYGGSAAGIDGVKAGKWFGTVQQTPATEGRLGMQQVIAAAQNGTNATAVDPLASLPNGGTITKANVTQFTPEWPG
ncbi:MAG TPA: sugar ABC transporter substrate-binding protein [Solirubrobacteraceae bacterium]|nr:sugar ABC transporter substrate-binding protein [Solirubrobacteraceae bacterium]